MARFLCAVAAFLVLAMTNASAYYIEITIDLDHLDKIKGDQPSGGNGGFGGRGGLGSGNPNMGGGIAGVGGNPNMAGLSGGKGMAGRGGMAGLAGISGGRGGMAGMGGFSGAGRGGMAGFGGSTPGNAGLAGMGGFGGNAGAAGFQGNGADIAVKEPPPSKIKVRFELTGSGIRQENIGRTVLYRIEHKWGRSTIIESDLIKIGLRKIDRVQKVFERERSKARKEKDKAAYFALAKWVLRHGMVAEFPKIMTDDLGKVAPDDPAFKAFTKIEDAMKIRPASDDPAAAWMKSQSGEKYQAKINPRFPHYTLITNSVKQEDIDAEFKRLEDNYRTFFYWFALQGKVLQVPKYRLIAILLTERDEFQSYHSIFKNIPIESAGFTARRDNVPVMYAKRLDPLYVQLDKENKLIWGSANREDLLRGSKKIPSSIEKANQQVLALVQQVMEEETQLATATHEGIRQLLAVTGLPQDATSSLWTPMIARNLCGPEWARFGLASFFETPEGAYWQGAGVPSWNYLIKFKFLLEDKKLGDMGDVLEKVITDQYFRDALATGNQEKLEMARATSWALAYYLVNGDDRAGQHIDKLFNYLRSVSKLPRDMELSNSALKKAFTQAFSLADANAEKLFANNWLGYMRKLNFEVPGFWSEAKKARADAIARMKDRDNTRDPQGSAVRPPNGAGNGPPNGSRRPMGPGGQRNPNGGP